MPTYSYRCTECDVAFDIHQAFSDASLTVCPTCGGMLRKVFSPIGVSFTGSGFYRNDSRAKPPGEKSPGEKGPGEKGQEKSSTEKAVTGKKTGAEKAVTGKKTDKSAPTKERAAATPSSTSGAGKAATTSTA